MGLAMSLKRFTYADLTHRHMCKIVNLPKLTPLGKFLRTYPKEVLVIMQNPAESDQVLNSI